MNRRIIAFIDADEEMLTMLHPEDGVGAAFEKEMARSEAPGGITVADWCISDADDEIEYGRYISYLFQWAMDHSQDVDATTHSIMHSPMTFQEWKEEQKA